MNVFDKRLIAAVIIVFLVLNILLLNFFLRWRYDDYSLLNRCKTHSFFVEDLKDYKGVLFINDSIKLTTSYKNDTPPFMMLYEFIQKGDSISLKANSDSLYLFRGGKKHWFIYYGAPCDK